MAEGKSEAAKFSKMLPTEVTIVESYVTWMEELAKHVEVSSMNKANSLADYIKLILEEQKKEQLSEDGKITCGTVSGTGGDGDNEDEDSDWSDSIGFIAMKLNVAGMYTYLEDYTSAIAHLKYTEREYLDKLDLQECHKQVIEYFRDSLSWSIGVLKGFEKAKKDGSSLNIVIKGSAKLNSKWEEMENGGDDKVKATLAFMKACLSAAMKVSEKATLDLLLEATKLDPQCHFWYHYAYRIMRRIRRNVKRSNGARLPPPSAEEARLAKAEHDLKPEDVVAVADYALVLKEKIWMRHGMVWKENEDEYLQCVELFEKALALAVEKGNKKWTRKIKIYLAEFLCFGKGEKLNQERGRQLFEECEIEYPTSTFVLHKVGKLYHHGLHSFEDHVGKGVDLKKAQDCYKRAIESNPGNFACLMDYVKLQQRLHDYSEMFDLIDKSLDHYKRDYQVSKLKLMRGYLTWVHNPKDLPDPQAAAVEEWLFVLKELPEFARHIYDAIKDPMFRDPEISTQAVKADIMKYLEEMKRDCDDQEKSELIEQFLEELAKPSFRERRFMHGGGTYRGNGRGGGRGARRNNGDGDAQNGGESLTEHMKRLSVSSRPNRQSSGRDEQGGNNWRKNKDNRGEGEGSGNENSAFGKARPQRYSGADEDQAWRKKE